MRLNSYKVIIFLILSVGCILFVNCQNEVEKDFPESYNVANFFLKSADYIQISESLKIVSEDDVKILNGLPNFVLPIPLSKMLRDVLKESDSSKCGQDLDYVFESILFPGGWAMKMLDSYGKPESGLLLGNFRWLSDYDECVGIYAPETIKENTTVGNFQGKYCTLQVPFNFGKISLPLSVAVCLPDSCITETEKKNSSMILNSVGSLGILGSVFGNVTIKCKSTFKNFTAGAAIVMTIISVIVFLALIGSSLTVFEYYMNTSAPKESIELETNGSTNKIAKNDAKKQVSLPDWLLKAKPFFNCFCIFTNGEKLLNTDNSEGQLPCLHGIRFMSMTWIIICHTYVSGVSVVKNILDLTKYIDHWLFQVVLNGFFSVDSFFLLSGFLVAYLFFKQVDKTGGRFPWLYFYIHRYVRLTPVYFLIVLFYTFILPFMGSGPIWTENIADKMCTKTWWSNLLYINNFLPQSDQCFSWSWYLANYMQFYAISPLFLITLWRWPIIGYSVVGVFFFITSITNFVLTYQYNLISGVGNIMQYSQDIIGFQAKINEFFEKLYYKPYARIGPYLVGVLLANFLHKRKKENAVKLNQIFLTVGWIFASGLTLTCQFGLYRQTPNKLGNAFYNTFSRTIFSFGLAWVMFVCIEGQANIVNRILSWKPWIPLSRLTFCTYLVHPVVQTAYYNSMRTLIPFNHNNMFMLYMGFLIISYAIALLVSLLFESPVIRLERLLRNRLASK